MSEKQNRKTENTNGTYGKCKRKIWKIRKMQTEIQAENRYETPKTRYLTPKTRYGHKEVGTRQKKLARGRRSRYGQWPTQKREEKLGTRQERKSVREAKYQHKRENKKCGKVLTVSDFLFLCVFSFEYVPLFCDYLHGIFARIFSKPQMQSPQSWFEPPKVRNDTELPPFTSIVRYPVVQSYWAWKFTKLGTKKRGF